MLSKTIAQYSIDLHQANSQDGSKDNNKGQCGLLTGGKQDLLPLTAR